MNDYNRYINAQKAGILIKVPGFYVGCNRFQGICGTIRNHLKKNRYPNEIL